MLRIVYEYYIPVYRIPRKMPRPPPWAEFSENVFSPETRLKGLYRAHTIKSGGSGNISLISFHRCIAQRWRSVSRWPTKSDEYFPRRGVLARSLDCGPEGHTVYLVPYISRLRGGSYAFPCMSRLGGLRETLRLMSGKRGG